MQLNIKSKTMNEHNINNVKVLTFKDWEKYEFMKHIFTTRKGGVSKGEFAEMNLSYTRGDDKHAVDINYKIIAQIMESDIADFVCSDQTHTDNIKIVTGKDRGKGTVLPRDYTDVDGLLTNEEELVLGCFFADCVPIYFMDPKKKVVGICHSGWRGTVKKIAVKMVQLMEKEFHSDIKDIYAAIGPSICKNCYEVSYDVYKEFIGLPYIEQIITDKGNGKYLLDLWKANECMLLYAGLSAKNIVVTDICTACNSEILFSHRKTGGKRGNLGAFVKIRKS